MTEFVTKQIRLLGHSLTDAAATNRGFYAIATLLAVAFFVLDLNMPLGFAGGVPYAALVLLGLWSPWRGHIIALGAISSVLTILGFYLSTAGGVPWVVLSNRALALIAIWVITIIAYQRHLRQEDAQETTALLATTFETVDLGFIVYDAHGVVVAFNSAFEKMFCFPPGFLHPGITHAEIIRFRAEAGQLGEGDVDELFKARIARPTQIIEYTRERTLPNGLSYLLHRKPMPNGGYVNAFTDITDAKRTEDEIRKLNDSLEEKVEERTAELKSAQENLVRTERLTAIGHLTGGIAHDFNNLLAVSLGNIELAEDAARVGGDIQPFLRSIRRANERSATLTGQLLAFARKQILFPQAIDAGELVSGMSDLLGSALGASVQMTVTGDDELWSCKVDAALLESAILNLALNAGEAMASGGTLTIGLTNITLDDDYTATQAETKSGDYVQIEVADTGKGMPESVLIHAVEPFYTTKGVGEGSGLGLSMVYGFTKQSGGHMTITSSVGRGTSVKLFLPRAEDA